MITTLEANLGFKNPALVELLEFEDPTADKRLMSSLLDKIGWIEGHHPETSDARAIIWGDKPWMYDRKVERVFIVMEAHPVVAAQLYQHHTKTPYAGYDKGGDAYVEEGLGFWFSSVRLRMGKRTIDIGKNVELKMFEQQAFKGYTFDRCI